jgi:8-oxo-dGTP diphosphatase
MEVYEERMKTKIYRRGVFVVVYRTNKDGEREYLLLRRKKHWIGWEFPKGGIERGEGLMQAVRREIVEETGQKGRRIRSYTFFGTYDYDRQFEDRPEITGQTFKLFSAEIKSKRVKIDRGEHSGYRWVSFRRAEKMLTWKNQKDALKLVEDKIKDEQN